MRSGDVAESTSALDDALRAFPDDETLLAAKAAVLQGAGDARAAFDCLQPKTASSQTSPALLVRAGLAALEFDSAAALELAERALRANADDSAALNLLVAAQLGVGDAQAALANCETLLAASPDDQYLIAMQTTAWRLLGDARYSEYCDYERLVVPSFARSAIGMVERCAVSRRRKTKPRSAARQTCGIRCCSNRCATAPKRPAISHAATIR